ncbi:MAG: YccF domain-containing protein [Chloroflexota bacterium]|nr:YccF domain-containing protein [Chloroflexota bacterium]
MNFLGNVIWLIFGGFITGLGYIIGGLLTCLTIVGIPFGMQAIKIGVATMTPFGTEITVAEDGGGSLQIIFNMIWLILFGWEIAVAHFVHGLVLAITIVGIPFAKQHFKLIPLALFPFGQVLK